VFLKNSLLLVALLTCVFSVSARTITAKPGDDVENIISTLLGGDTLILEDGNYPLTERFSFSLSGTADQPIIIRAADDAHPRFHRAGVNQNIWDIENAHYVTIDGLHFSGGSAGVRVWIASHFTFSNNEIFGTDDAALTMNIDGGKYDTVSILNNHIHDTRGTGEGMYLGCNFNKCQLSNSLIEGNYIHDTLNAEQGDGIEVKEGSSGNIIRNNVIHDTNYPCILTYGTLGNGDQNIIENNFVYNCGDHGIQSAADTIIRNNIVLKTKLDGIAMQHHQSSAPSNLVVVNNTVVKATGAAISLNGNRGSVIIANNALYSEAGKSLELSNTNNALLKLSGNVGSGPYDGPSGFKQGNIATDFVQGHYQGAPPIDLHPAAKSKLLRAGESSVAVTTDFDGNKLGRLVDAGAYVYNTTKNKLGWVLSNSFKGQQNTPVSAMKFKQQPLPPWGCIPIPNPK
jgi:hypothetical protein